jgi:HlyD family secretion protein
MKRRLIVIIALVVIGGIAWSVWKSGSRDAGNGRTFYGNVDIREVNLGFRVAGRVAKVFKDEGDAVRAGDVIATLDDEPFRTRLEEAKANLASLSAVRDMKRNGFRAEEISQIEAALAERGAALENAQAELARRKSLLATRAVSQQDYDSVEALYREASARYNSTKQNLSLMKAGFRAEEIAQAEADAAKAEASLHAAETDLADATLIAPEDGVVMTRAVEPGSIVQAGSTVATVNLGDPVWVRAYVGEPFLGLVKPGGNVLITSDLDPKKTYHGRIGYVSPRAEFTPKSVETTDLRTALVYRFRVVVSDPDSSLRQGMPVTVRLAGD